MSFVEMGVNRSITELDFSVLSWNHPGFGCSTGVPSPRTEAEVRGGVALRAGASRC